MLDDLLSEVDAILLLEDTSGAGEGELGDVVLIQALDKIALGRGQGGLSSDQREIVVNSGSNPVGFVAEGPRSEIDVGAGHLDQLSARMDVEQRGSDLLIDAAAEILNLGVCGIQLRLGRLDVAAQARFAKDGDTQRALGKEGAMRTDATDVGNSVVAVEAEGGKTLASVGCMDCAQLDDLILKILVVLPVFVGNGADFFGGLRGQFAVGGAVSEDNTLPRIDADFALEQDQIFIDDRLGGNESLLLGFELNAGAEFIDVGDGTGLMLGLGLVKQHLISLLEGLGVVHFAGGGDGMKVGSGDLLDDFAASRHFGEMRRTGGGAGGAPSCNYGT